MKITATILVVLSVVLIIIVVEFIWRAHMDHRSLPGHIVRRLHGESGFQQTTNDLGEDIRRVPQLQQWSIDTLSRFRSGKVNTDRGSGSLPDFIPNVRLAREERPEFLKKLWGETNSRGEEEPEILALLSTNGQPNCIAVNWYDHGVAVGPTNYLLSFAPDLSIKIRPGIYVYGFNFK